jgi:hypothetical protein
LNVLFSLSFLQNISKGIKAEHGSPGGGSSKDAHEVVENLYAEIELLMLSGGYSRETAVRMLLQKAAKERGLQVQSNVEPTKEHEELLPAHNQHLHRAASMSSAPVPNHHYASNVHYEVGGALSLSSAPIPVSRDFPPDNFSTSSVGTGNSATYHSALHASQSMYSMPSPHSMAYHSTRGPDVPLNNIYPEGHRQFPSSFPTTQVPSGGVRRGSTSSSVASNGSNGGNFSSSKSERDALPSILAKQELKYGVNMLEYLAPDDPEVLRLMSQFGFTKIDAMIAVFQQFPPQQKVVSPAYPPPLQHERHPGPLDHRTNASFSAPAPMSIPTNNVRTSDMSSLRPSGAAVDNQVKY